MSVTEKSAPEPPFGAHYQRSLLTLLFSINTLNYLDRYTLPGVAPLLGTSFALDDFRLGLLGTAFLVVYALAGPLLGHLADQHRRPAIISVGVAIWSVATAFTALCQTFPQLILARSVLGIGEASYFPAGSSLIADAFPAERRSRIMALRDSAVPVGVFLGYAVGGVVGQRFGWRAAFLIAGVPGLILAGLFARQREPLRGASEGLVLAPAPRAGVLALSLLRIPTFTLTVISQCFAYFVLGGVSFWLTSYLTRHFHLSAGGAGIVAGAVFVAGGGAGTLAGGFIADALLRRTPAARLLVPSIGLLSSAVLTSIALLTHSLSVFLVLYAIIGFTLQLQSGPISAVLQDIINPSLRSRSVSLALLLSHMFGDAFSPALLGLLSDALGGATRGGLERAFWVTPFCCLAAATFTLLGARSVGRDRECMLLQARQA
ncbi:MAG: MFS transporter [Chloroflexi bacterium]|nr:MFS transporter [Chloroflexota bacterium]